MWDGQFYSRAIFHYAGTGNTTFAFLIREKNCHFWPGYDEKWITITKKMLSVINFQLLIIKSCMNQWIMCSPTYFLSQPAFLTSRFALWANSSLNNNKRQFEFQLRETPTSIWLCLIKYAMMVLRMPFGISIIKHVPVEKKRKIIEPAELHMDNLRINNFFFFTILS